MNMVVVGIDLGKNTCSLVGMDAAGRVVLRRRLRQGSLESFVCGLGPCIVAMEACCSSPRANFCRAGLGGSTDGHACAWVESPEPLL